MPERREVIESRSVFSGKLLEVAVDTIRLPDGSISTREVVHHPGAAAVVAVNDERVLFVVQHRHPAGRDLVEIPAGKLDRADEDPETCAKRELAEETGYEAGRIEPLVSYFPSPGFCDERIHVFLAQEVAVSGPAPLSDEGEPIAVRWMPFREALRAAGEGGIEDSKSIVGLFAAALRLGWLREI